MDIDEFSATISIKRLNKTVSGQIFSCQGSTRTLKGYRVVDNEVALTSLTGWNFLKILGKTMDRALVFTNISPEKSPMMALCFSLLKPVALVYHLYQPSELDVRLAKDAEITLIHSKARNVESLLKALRRLYAAVADKK